MTTRHIPVLDQQLAELDPEVTSPVLYDPDGCRRDG